MVKYRCDNGASFPDIIPMNCTAFREQFPILISTGLSLKINKTEGCARGNMSDSYDNLSKF